MDFDFSLLLVVLVLFCGAVSLSDWLWFAKKRRAADTDLSAQINAQLGASTLDKPDAPSEVQTQESPSEMAPWWIEYPKSFFPVLLIVLLLRSFLVEPFKIPSGSMLPTLRIGDFILVNKFAYGLRLPVLGTKFVAIDDPQRGDIMVFKYPESPKVNYIKRVIAIPGDRVVYQNKRITLNGKPLEYEVTAESFEHLFLTESVGEVDHRIQIDIQRPGSVGDWKVPEGHYFVMGDNRDNSSDSRVWGFVPESLIVGKAFAIWMHKPGLVPSFSRNGSIE